MTDAPGDQLTCNTINYGRDSVWTGHKAVVGLALRNLVSVALLVNVVDPEVGGEVSSVRLSVNLPRTSPIHLTLISN